MTSAESSFGILLKIGDGAGPPENFTNIAEVKDIDGPSIELATEEVTHHESTGGWREYVATLLEMAEIDFDVNWLPGHATQDHNTGLLADQINKTLRTFQIVLNDTNSTTFEFSAYVGSVEGSGPVDGVREGSITLRPSGQPTITP